ncbi:MAG: response regulator [Firmicutes bacterium]|nr:response regulator [Bacillota bacterium]
MVARKHVLIADDQQGVRRLLMELLGVDRFHYSEAATGQEVLEVIRAGEVSLVLLDLKMPRMDGVEALKAILELPAPPPVVMITAQGQKDLGQRLINMGAAAFLEKPFDVGHLHAVVDKFTGSGNGDNS